jgi:sensor histidine kinase YesM
MSSLLKYRPFDSRNLLINLIFSFTISGIITSINVYVGDFENNYWQVLQAYSLNTLFVFIGFSIMAYPIISLIQRLNKIVPWSSSWFKRVLVDILMIIIISVIAALVFSLLFTQSKSENQQTFNLVATYFTFSFIACMTFVLLIEAVVFFNEREAYLKKNEKLIRENLETKFEALKNQINPHFLFNNLNVLSSLVYKDPKQADRFIVEFSNIYRYILDMQNETTVTVEKEMKFLDSYIYLLEQRFKNSLHINKNVSSQSLDKTLPPLTMQLLMENVIKHNSISPNDPLEVKILDEKDTLFFSNKIMLRQQHTASSGIGLSNIRERYALISTRMPVFSDSNGYFTAKIPLLNKSND